MSGSMFAVEITEHFYITVQDGTKLAAKLWMPVPVSPDSQPAKFSAILEYLPYRKSDWTARRDSLNHDWMAARGFAIVRVDIRGTGDSEGHQDDEYTMQEIDDGVEIVNWIAQQDWCTGRVGLFGKSWGGFNGLQIAQRQPEALRGVISLYSTDDRYADDVHYTGGCVLGSEALSWASVMFAWNARPPLPGNVGPNWKDVWLKRLERHKPFLHEWLAHQARDKYWQHGSVCEDFAGIRCPVLAIGGWADGYHNAVLRLVAGLPGFRKGIIGPWSHDWPNIATPGPQIGFLETCRQWWEFCLNGVKNEVEHYPDLQIFVREHVEPSAQTSLAPGKWVGIQELPSSTHSKRRTFSLGPRLLEPMSSISRKIEGDPCYHIESGLRRTVQTTTLQGSWAGEWLSFGGPDMPGTQNIEDALALSWDTEPLEASIELFGHPELDLDIEVDQPQACVIARLCDVSPAGSSALICRGILNLTHRAGHDVNSLAICPIKEPFRVHLKLNACAYEIQKGHKLRLSLCSFYWPLVWPSPHPTTLTVLGSPSMTTNTLSFPLLPERVPCPITKHPVEIGAALKCLCLKPGRDLERKLEVSLSHGTQSLVVSEDEGQNLLLNSGIIMEEQGVKIYTIHSDSTSPTVHIQRSLRYQQLEDHALAIIRQHAQEPFSVELLENIESQPKQWMVEIDTNSSMSSDENFFHLEDELIVKHDHKQVMRKKWKKDIKRYFV